MSDLSDCGAMLMSVNQVLVSAINEKGGSTNRKHWKTAERWVDVQFLKEFQEKEFQEKRKGEFNQNKSKILKSPQIIIISFT